MSGIKFINVTQPFLPPLNEFIPYLEQIWDNKWLTNNGDMHNALEKQLQKYLKVQHLSLFTNGTLPIITALQALRLTGEVITTPYSFVATTHSLWWNGIKPVFVDVEPETFTIDPERIEQAITPRTTAILPVHVYGYPCKVDAIQAIADKYGLKVIYDAAHAFGVEINGKSILDAGDMSTLSFHATKTYNTAEGGALICHDEDSKKRIDFLKNFGFAGETEVVAPGINAKMDEIRSALGLLNLKYIDTSIAKRKILTQKYRELLINIPGITFLEDIENVRHNYSYFPIFVNEKVFGKSRDDLYAKLRAGNIFGRRYFYPLISSFSSYRGLDSARQENLPVAHKASESVICLPMHHDLSLEDINDIISLIK